MNLGKTAFLISVSALSMSALAACANKSAAPVVYGSQPQWQGRIYNSADEIADERARADARREARAARRANLDRSSSRTSSLAALDDSERATPAPSPRIEVTEPAPLVRASATSPQRFDYDARPVYLNTQERARARQAAADEPTLSPSSVSAEMVEVRPGDTVYAISRRTGASPQSIIKANRLKEPYLLEVGQKLRMPNSAGAAPATSSVSSVPTSSGTRRSDRIHMVRAGDTLSSIARSTGVSIADIARANRLTAPYTLSIGDRLRVPGTAQSASGGQTTSKAVAATTVTTKPESRDPVPQISLSQPAKSPEDLFNWPVKGAVIGKYSASDASTRNDGINIAAPVGTPVRAAADGEVVYRGAELNGYGNLLLVKHDDGYVTAYAHNEAMLVRKGDRVRRGQVIAKVGQTGSATQPQLHFEIRHNLKAVDPLALLDN